MTTRTRNTLGCLFALGLVLLAFCTMDRRDADATEGSGYPEVKMEAVNAVPPSEVLYMDSIHKCVIGLDGEELCGTIREAR